MLQKLREKREAARNKILQLRDTISKEDRDFNTEEKAAWDAANRDYDELTRRIDVLERGEKIEKAAESRELPPGADDVIPVKRGKENKGIDRAKVEEYRALAFQGWLLRQSGIALDDRQRRACKLTGINPNAKFIDFRLQPTGYQKRDLSVGTNSAGGYTIPEGFVNRLEKSLLAFGNVRAVADIIRTDTGNPLPWPTVSDHANSASVLAENTAVGEADPTFGEVVFNAYKYSSDLVQISHELMTDSAFNLAETLGDLLGERISRGQNPHFTTGDGTSKPTGIVTGASSGVTAASTTAITFDEIIDLVHSIDPAYRVDPSCGFMMHDTVMKAVRKLKDGDSRYLWEPSTQAGEPSRLLGYPVHVNQNMASSIAASAKTILFGALKKYKIRDAGKIRLIRLNERYADADQVGFVAFMRSDGKLLDAGTDPVKYLTQAAV